MKVMQLEQYAAIGTSPLVARKLPMPVPGPGEIRVRVRCCGICRTDLHVIEGELAPSRLPIVPGHQIVGIVDALGAGATRFETGTRVGIAWLRSTCGFCEYCRSGRENLCEAARFTGYHEHGGFAEYALVNESFAYRIPEAFSDTAAAPLLCAGIIGYRALRRANLSPKGMLLLYGFGSSAHIVIQLALSRGSQVMVITRGDKHRELAQSMGAVWVGQTSKDLPEKADSAIIFAPAGELVPDALESLKKGGTLSLAGIHLSEVPKLNYSRHLFFEKNIHSVTANTRQDGEELLAEAARIPIIPYTTTYRLQDANLALQDLSQDKIRGSGVLVI